MRNAAGPRKCPGTVSEMRQSSALERPVVSARCRKRQAGPMEHIGFAAHLKISEEARSAGTCIWNESDGWVIPGAVLARPRRSALGSKSKPRSTTSVRQSMFIASHVFTTYGHYMMQLICEVCEVNRRDGPPAVATSLLAAGPAGQNRCR